jgi:hypothetical protein
MTIKYVWREPFTQFAGVKGSDAQEIGESIQRIKNDHGGDLRPRYVWQAAKSVRHPLHRYFLWDQEAAAQAHWDSTARKLIGSIRIVGDDDRPEGSPAFISINAKEGVSYKTLDEVLDSEDMQALVLRQAEQELKAFERRFQMLSDICAVIRKARVMIEKRRAKGKPKPDDDRPRPSA